MTNNLFFTCGFQREKDWIVASNRERVSSIDKVRMIYQNLLKISIIENKKCGQFLRSFKTL